MRLLLLWTLLLSPFVYERTIPRGGTIVDVDDTGYIYLTQPQRIEKLQPDGKLMFRTADLNYGEITSFDLTNPLMPFAYYRDQAKIVFFDNTLSQQGTPVDLFEQGFVQVEYVCGSRGDAFWLWDARMSELIRVNRQFQRISSSGNLGVLLGLKVAPVQLIEKGSSLYLYDKNHGVFLFDIYGNYRTRISIRTDHPIDIIDDRIIYSRQDSLHILDKSLVSEEVIPMPAEAHNAFTLWKDQLFLTSKTETRVFRYQHAVKN